MAEFPVTVRRLARSRRLRLRVLPDGSVLVTVPRLAPARLVDQFVAEHQQWINDQRTKILDRRQYLTASRENLLLRGRPLQFRLSVNSQLKGAVALEGDRLSVISQSEDDGTVRQLLESWYKQQAKMYFGNRLPLLADVVNRDVVHLSIRSSRTRWGACTSRNTISLNWRLILAPDWVSDYVIYHELAHLTHMNHSKRFWQLVEDYHPRYQEAEAWLKDHHQLLEF